MLNKVLQKIDNLISEEWLFCKDNKNAIVYEGKGKKDSEILTSEVTAKNPISIFNNVGYTLKIDALKSLAESFILNGISDLLIPLKEEFLSSNKRNFTTPLIKNSKELAVIKPLFTYLKNLIALTKLGKKNQNLKAISKENPLVQVFDYNLDGVRILVYKNTSENTQKIVVNDQSEVLSEVFLERKSFESFNLLDSGNVIKLLPLQTRIFALFGQGQDYEKTYLALSDKDWEIVDSDKNVLVLDKCTPCIDDVIYPEIYNLDLSDKLNKLKPNSIKAEYEFNSEVESEVFIKLENAFVFNVELNGEILLKIPNNVAESGVNLYKAKLKKGINNLAVFYAFSKNADCFNIENVYILGDFSLKVVGEGKAKSCVKFMEVGAIVPLKEKIKISSITASGRYFFGGSLTVQKKINVKTLPKNANLSLKLYNSVARVNINGKDNLDYVWNGTEYAVSKYLRQGENVITIQIFNGYRNLFGPFHHKDGEPSKISDAEFLLNPIETKKVNDFTELYFVKDFGVSTDV